MLVLDTNIFIYLAKGTLPVQKLAEGDLAFPSVSKIEALGYANITVAEQSYLEALFAECQQLDLNEAVVQRAIRLRQQIKISLGDAIVAATALEYDSELWTANEGDFARVDGLKVYNPLNS